MCSTHMLRKKLKHHFGQKKKNLQRLGYLETCTKGVTVLSRLYCHITLQPHVSIGVIIVLCFFFFLILLAYVQILYR